MPKETGEKLIVQNKKARHDYAIEDKYEAGLALTGTEVKSLREGRASLSEAFISIDRRGEMWLEGANIPEYLNGTWNNHAPKRKRKLLLHRLQKKLRPKPKPSLAPKSWPRKKRLKKPPLKKPKLPPMPPKPKTWSSVVRKRWMKLLRFAP